MRFISYLRQNLGFNPHLDNRFTYRHIDFRLTSGRLECWIPGHMRRYGFIGFWHPIYIETGWNQFILKREYPVLNTEQAARTFIDQWYTSIREMRQSFS